MYPLDVPDLPGDYEVVDGSLLLRVRDAGKCTIKHEAVGKDPTWRYSIYVSEKPWRQLDATVRLPFLHLRTAIFDCGCILLSSPPIPETDWIAANENNDNISFYAKFPKMPGPVSQNRMILHDHGVLPFPSSAPTWADAVEFRRARDRWEYRYVWACSSLTDLRSCLSDAIQLLMPSARVYTARCIMKLVHHLENSIPQDVLELIATYV